MNEHQFRLKAVAIASIWEQCLSAMYNFVGLVMLECWWLPGYYVAVQSTTNHYYLDVFLKKAATIAKALSSKTRWVQQNYQIPWVDLISPWFLEHRGAEIVLWSNDFPGETGVTLGYRFLGYPSKWIYANVVVPHMTPSEMQLSYLQWGHRFMDYATNICWEIDETTSVWPHVYARKEPLSRTDSFHQGCDSTLCSWEVALSWAISEQSQSSVSLAMPLVLTLLSTCLKFAVLVVNFACCELDLMFGLWMSQSEEMQVWSSHAFRNCESSSLPVWCCGFQVWC